MGKEFNEAVEAQQTSPQHYPQSAMNEVVDSWQTYKGPKQNEFPSPIGTTMVLPKAEISDCEIILNPGSSLEIEGAIKIECKDPDRKPIVFDGLKKEFPIHHMPYPLEKFVDDFQDAIKKSSLSAQEEKPSGKPTHRFPPAAEKAGLAQPTEKSKSTAVGASTTDTQSQKQERKQIQTNAA
ncbi:MAG TPA: hypothetical protein V6D17_18090 [Candidatus Obscuribacterales bacterium]